MNKIIIWNIRSIADKEAKRRVHQLKKLYILKTMGIREPLVNRMSAPSVASSLGFLMFWFIRLAISRFSFLI